MPIDMALKRNPPISEEVVVDADITVEGENFSAYFVNLNELGCSELKGSQETLAIDSSPQDGGRMCIVIETPKVSGIDTTFKEIDAKRATEIGALIRNFKI